MNSTLQDASNKEVAGIAIVVLVLVVSPIIIILVRNAVATIQVSEPNYRTHSPCIFFVRIAVSCGKKIARQSFVTWNFHLGKSCIDNFN